MKWFVPGRLEVLGKHTDYAGGRSLLAAVDRGITVSLEDATSGISATTTASPHMFTTTESTLPRGHWGNYVQAVVDRLVRNFGQLKPARLRFESNLSLASGMSSSSALVVATALSLIEHNDLRSRPEWQANIHSDIDLASYMACFENGLSFGSLEGIRGVGTFGGSEDHTAMLCCKPDQLTEFTFCPIVEGRSVDFLPEWSFVVAVSGVLAEKTGSALERYNQASLRTREIMAAWNAATGRDDAVIADALASSEDALVGLRAVVAHSPVLSARLRAFLTESEDLIPAALRALAARDLASLGLISDASQRNAEEQLGNQVPETSFLQRSARELGALAAAGFGAGFGGSVWALLPTSEADVFSERWLGTYRKRFPAAAGATVMVTRPGGPARRLD